MSSPSDFDPAQEVLKSVIDALKPLKEDQRRFVLFSASAWFNDSDKIPMAININKIGSAVTQDGIPELEEFVFSKKSDKDVERITVLAYYLTEYRKKEEFKTADLEALRKEAGEHPFGNIKKTVNNATLRNGFFVSTQNGFKRLHRLGRLVVEALPDEQRVKAIIDQHKPRPKRRSVKKVANNNRGED